MTNQNMTSNSNDRPHAKRTRSFVILLLIVMISLSGFYLKFTWSRYQEAASSEAIMLAESLESLLHPEHLSVLSGNINDLQKPEYTTIKLSLIRLVEAKNRIRFAYLMAMQNGKVIFLMDSELPDSPDYSPPGQVYTEADEQTLEPFQTGKTVLCRPMTDRWGTWISVLVPIKDDNGAVIDILGLDYPAEDWNARLWNQMIPDGLIVFSVFMLLIALLNSQAQRLRLDTLSKKLAMDEALYRSVFNQAPIGIAIVNDKEFVLQSEFGNSNINPMFEHILDRSSTELARIKWPLITYPDDLAADLENFERFKTGLIDGYSMEKRFVRPDGSVVWTNMKISALLGSPDMHLCLLEDISAQKEAEQSLRESERSKSVLLSNLPGLAYRCNYDREWNRILPLMLPLRYEYEITTAAGERKWVLEMGQGIYNTDGEIEALEGIVLDISAEKEIEEIFKYNSEHDIWTGLYNRRYLENLLKEDARSRSVKKRALIGINMSAVQSLNLAYGFQYSQELIKKIVKTLGTLCTERRQLFNTYENRFVFYIKGYKDIAELTAFCDVIVRELKSVLDDERIGAGMGVFEINDENKNDVDEIFKNLLVASEKAINTTEADVTYCFFDKEMQAHIEREEKICSELSQIGVGQQVERLFLLFQPILDLKTNCICGFEALARLNSDKYGLVSPLEFISLAEKKNLIISLGDEIIRQAFRFSNKLKENGHNVSVSINISAIQLLKTDFSANLFSLMEQMQVNPANIGLEITESIFACNYEEINRILAVLREKGIYIAIDDFGTGYSSLARERELNVSCLKIDKHFIDNLLGNPKDELITGDIISMAHKLGHCTIAEGVEYESQLLYLKEHGCDKIQGYLIGKPLDEKTALDFLKNQSALSCMCNAAVIPTVSDPKIETLESYQDQLKLILDSTAEAIYGLDLDGNCTFCNASCIQLLGYHKQSDLLYKEMHTQIHNKHKDGSPFPIEHCKIFRSIREGRGYTADDEVFWRADGTSFDVEYHSYPQIKDGKVVGAVITFMDITEKKQKEEEIEYLYCHDVLTGLYNRRCLEEHRGKIDIPENLPLSVIFADINGLKLTNDIFGHAAGDELIKKSAQIITSSCRENDVVARVGGDEFILLLPKTHKKDAEKVLSQIKSGFADARVEAVKCSISIGSDTKTIDQQSLEVVIANAENAMYKDKTLNRKSINKNMIDTILETLHTKSPQERRHSVAVKKLCGDLGALMHLPEAEIDKLKRIGYLHDIGKIILDEAILTKDSPLTNEELEKMKQHPVVGYRILNLFDDTLDLAEYVYAHHERWDGSGFPRGLKGEQIPLISRILIIAETYEREMGRKSFTLQKKKKTALELIKKYSGIRFDPQITAVFVQMMEGQN